MKSFTPGLTLKQRRKETWKSPIMGSGTLCTVCALNLFSTVLLGYNELGGNTRGNRRVNFTLEAMPTNQTLL